MSPRTCAACCAALDGVGRSARPLSVPRPPSRGGCGTPGRSLKRAKAEGHSGFSERERLLVVIYPWQGLGAARSNTYPVPLFPLAQPVGRLGSSPTRRRIWVRCWHDPWGGPPWLGLLWVAPDSRCDLFVREWAEHAPVEKNSGGAGQAPPAAAGGLLARFCPGSES